MSDSDAAAAWGAVYDALTPLPGWKASRPVYNDGERGRVPALLQKH